MDQADLYHEAMSVHRHYDSMSSATLSLLAAVIGGTPVLYQNTQALAGSPLFLVFSAVLIQTLLTIYGRFDRHATVALNVAAALETGANEADDKPIHGFAHVFKHAKNYPSLDATPGGRIYSTVRIIAFVCAVAYGAAGVLLLFSK